MSEIVADNQSAQLLIRMSDPDIPDQDLANRNSGALRTAARHQDEDPTVSAHVVIKTDAQFDAARQYPCAIENIDFLSRSTIVAYLNDLISRHFVRERPRANGELRPFHPRVQFGADATNTIGGALLDGFVLKGVKWRRDHVDGGVLGDNPHHLTTTEDIQVKVAGRPTGQRAQDILEDTWRRIRGDAPRKVLVLLEDENGKSKSVMADTQGHNILANFFVPQEKLGPFNPPMAMCQPAIRQDMVAGMLGLI